MAASDLSNLILGNNFHLAEILGKGGMSTVYRARELNLKRDVAVKVLAPVLALEPGYVARLNVEAQTAAGLENSHIVPVHDFGIEGDISYVVMRLLRGRSLSDRIKYRVEHNEPLPSLTDVSTILEQVAGALDYAHKQGDPPRR